MRIFKGFAQIGPLTDNAANVVAPVGELSTRSRTFTKDLTEHVDNAYLGETLIGFSHTNNGVKGRITASDASKILKAVNWIYTQARLSKFTENRESFQQQFISANGSEYDLISSGEMIAFSTYFAPEYIEIAPAGQSANYLWRVWFANESFYNQYDEFEILVVPPITNLNLFFDDYADVKKLIDAVSQGDVFQRLATAVGKYPQTTQRSDMFQWQDRNDPTLKIPTHWVTAHYGLAGNNLDAVKEAIRTYILANSTHDRDEWATIFPDLFTSTEFIITPMWNDYAVPNQVRESGVYSSILPFQKAMALSYKTCKGTKYTNAHIARVISGITALHKAISCAVVGGPENRNGIDILNEKFPDYICVPTTHPDFMLMSEDTRGFVMLLSEMLMHAEELTSNSGVPQNFNRLIRDGVTYLATSYKDFLWLVVTKQTVEQLGG